MLNWLQFWIMREKSCLASRNLCRASRKGAKDIGGCLMLLQIWSWEHIHIGRPIIRTIRPDGQHDQEDDAGDFEPVLGSQHRRGLDPLAVR